jgi:translation initiation factor IF-1
LARVVRERGTPKDRGDMIVTKGRIMDASPGARFKVKLDNGHILNAVISGKIRKNNIQILLDDLVEIEMSPYDLTLGRITYRF